jgi:hypothetical protein
MNGMLLQNNRGKAAIRINLIGLRELDADNLYGTTIILI